MRKILEIAFSLTLIASAAAAQTCGSLPDNLTNGTVADATQVMANFNALLSCINNNGSVGSGTAGQVGYYSATGNTISGESLSSLIDSAFGSTQGSILYRGASGWTMLAPGTSGQFLETLGAGVNPQWAAPTGSGGGITPPNVVQTAFGHTASSSSTSFTVTFSANTTVGDLVAFIYAGYGNSANTITYPAGCEQVFRDAGSTAYLQQVAVCVMPITTAATVYTTTLGSPAGGMNAMAIEMSGAGYATASSYLPSLSSDTLTALALMMPQQTVCYGALEVDGSGSAPPSVSSVTSGWTNLSYSLGGTGHSALFLQIPSTSRGGPQSATYSTAPAGNVIGITACFQ